MIEADQERARRFATEMVGKVIYYIGETDFFTMCRIVGPSPHEANVIVHLKTPGFDRHDRSVHVDRLSEKKPEGNYEFRTTGYFRDCWFNMDREDRDFPDE